MSGSNRRRQPWIGGVLAFVVIASLVAGEATPIPLGYHPAGMSMWDAWAIEHQGTAHLFHLQRLAKGSSRTETEAEHLGHAVSEDLLHWRELPLALGPGPTGSLDDMQPWTGSVVAHDGMFSLFYTMRSLADRGARQRIGLATSPDLLTWTRHAGNPILEPDQRWYASATHPDPGGVVDCRDLVVIRNPSADGWLGFYAGRTPEAGLAEGAVIAVVRSIDLVHWEHLPPAFAPKKYACIEVPDVFLLDGRWYLTALTGHEYGNRGIFSDPHVTRGTIYAVAERPEGPYHELPDDNVLMGGDQQTGYSCRTLVFRGERVLLCTQGIPGGPAILSPPFSVRADGAGHLRVAYSALSAGWRRTTLVDATTPLPSVRLAPSHYRWTMPVGTWLLDDRTYHGKAAAGWQMANLGVAARSADISATLTLDTGAAVGFVWGGMKDGRSKDLVVMLDAEAQCVRAGMTPQFAEPFVRRQLLAHGQSYRLRLVVRPPRFEVYLDEVLVLQSALPASAFGNDAQADPPGIGLFVDRGQADISHLEIYELGPKP